MAASYIAYIDEAGDEGFDFWENGGGSSRWLVLSAVVVRRSLHADLAQSVDKACASLMRQSREPVHFRKLTHHRRVSFLRQIAETPIQTISVVVDKVSLEKRKEFQDDGHMLYRFLCKFLMERISWCCREDGRQIDVDGDGYCDIIFSKRKSMSYQQLIDYLRLLRENRGLSRSTHRTKFTCSIDWSRLDPDRVHAVSHGELQGLLVADAVASGTFSAVTLNQFQEAEPRYFEIMRGRVFRQNGNALGKGLKFWPTDLPDLVLTHDRFRVFERCDLR